MNSNYGKSNSKMGSIKAFDFDLGLDSNRAKPVKDQKNQGSSYSSTNYTQKPNTASSWTSQSNKPSWSHIPAASVQSSMTGSLSGPTSMVGDIFGKTWNAGTPSNTSTPEVGIVNNKNPNLFGDLVNSSIGQNKSGNDVPLKHVARPTSQSSLSMGGMADSLPKNTTPAQTSGSWGYSYSSSRGSVNSSGNYNLNSSPSGGNVNLGGNGNRNQNLGGPSMKSMAGNTKGGGEVGTNKDPFAAFCDFGSKQPNKINSTSKEYGKSSFENNSFGEFQNATSQTSAPHVSPGASKTGKSDPIDDFGFVNSQNQAHPIRQPSVSNDFDALFSSSSNGGTVGSAGFTSQQIPGDDNWGISSEFEGGADTAGTTELEDLPPPPAGVTASAAKNKGMDNYKQGQYSDAIKWLSWAVILFQKAGDEEGIMQVLTSRASCYKEVGEYKKAVADCTKILGHDETNISVLVQRSILYESMEKYKLGAEDLRTVMKLDPNNRIALSTIHRLTKMAE